MSDYEGLDYEARVDAAMDDVLGRDGWCGVCGGWSPADPPTCDLCGVRLCDRCAVEYPDGAFECPDCAKADIDRYDRIMAPAWACPTRSSTRPGSCTRPAMGRSPGMIGGRCWND